MEHHPPHQARTHLWALIKHCPFATLVTLEANGNLRGHSIGCCQLEFDNELWFFAANDSPLVASIEDNPEVCVLYGQPAQADFVSISGIALVITNIAKKEQLWNPRAQTCFPQGPSSSDIVLLRVAIDHAEYRDARSNKLLHFSRRSPPARTANAVVKEPHVTPRALTM